MDSQVSAHRLPSRTQSSYQAVSRKESHARHLQILLVGKGADCISSGFLSRSSNKSHIDLPLLHIGSQVTAHRLPYRTQSSYSAISHKEVHVRHLQIRFVCQCVVCALTLILAVPPISFPPALAFLFL
jgi:extradiol dioxygenase family protein